MFIRRIEDYRNRGNPCSNGGRSFPRRSSPLGFSSARSFFRKFFFLLGFSATFFARLYFPRHFFAKKMNQPNQMELSQTKIKPDLIISNLTESSLT